MKKTLLLTLAIGAASAMQMMASDLYITGSTAFRANVYNACTKLYDNGAPANVVYGTSATGGNSPQSPVANNYQWTMTGTVSNTISAMGQTTLTIHALFTGSVQGVQTVEQSTKLIFLDATGNAITNTPTIAFTDVSSTSTPYPASGNFSEEKICVQPFVMCKSVALSSAVTNVTWDALRSAIQPGRIPLSVWSHNTNDRSSFVYLVQRTKDSGTRRTELAEVQFTFNQSASIYLFDNVTNNAFWKPSSSSTVIVGAAGNNNANLNWGSGYVGGGDVKTELAYNFAGNQALAILSIADAKGITGVNWSQVMPFNSTWPTAAASGLSGNTGTNDYSPVSDGQYPLWAYEVVVYPTVDPSSISTDQNLTASQLGNQSTAGTILGVLDYVNQVAPFTPLIGSIENEIENSKVGGATAVRLKDMTASRSSVGGTITP